MEIPDTLRKTNHTLLLTIHHVINHTNTSIQKLNSLFNLKYASAFALTTNDDVALFLSNNISSDLLHFFTDLHLEKIDPTEWLTVYHDELNCINHSSKQDVEQLKDQINDELCALFREFFQTDFSSDLKKLTKEIVLLILLCLASSAELFMPEPIQDELSLRLSSFWNARLGNDVFQSAELICMPVVQKVCPDENAYSFKTHTISVSAVTTEAPLSPYTPTMRKKVSFIDEEIISRFSEVSDGSESLNVGKKSLIVISEDLEKITSEVIDSQANDHFNSSSKIINDNKETNNVEILPIVHENIEITSNNVEFNPITSNNVEFNPITSNNVEFNPITSNNVEFNPIASNNVEINPITIISNTGKRFEVEMPPSPTLKAKKLVRFNANPKINKNSPKNEQFSNSTGVEVNDINLSSSQSGIRKLDQMIPLQNHEDVTEIPQNESTIDSYYKKNYEEPPQIKPPNSNSSPLFVSALASSFKTVNIQIRDLLYKLLSNVTNPNETFKAIDEKFANRFGKSVQISKNSRALLGYLMNIVSSQLINVFAEIRGDNLTPLVERERIFFEYYNLGKDTTEIQPKIKKEICSLFENIFQINQSDPIFESDDISNISRSISLLFLKCFATASKPFMANANSETKRFDADEVYLTPDQLLIQGRHEFILFPSFWSAKMGNLVIFKSGIVSFKSRKIDHESDIKVEKKVTFIVEPMQETDDDSEVENCQSIPSRNVLGSKKDELTELSLKEIAASFQECNRLLKELLISQFLKISNPSLIFERFNNLFSSRFGAHTRITEDSHALIGYFMFYISSELNQFYADLSSQNISESELRTVFCYKTHHDPNEPQEDHIGFEEDIEEVLDLLVKDLLCITDDVHLKDLSAFSKKISMLILKCLATSCVPLIADPLIDGSFDSKDVTSADNDLGGNIIQFPSFWSGRDFEGKVFFKSSLVTVNVVKYRNEENGVVSKRSETGSSGHSVRVSPISPSFGTVSSASVENFENDVGQEPTRKADPYYLPSPSPRSPISFFTPNNSINEQAKINEPGNSGKLNDTPPKRKSSGGSILLNKNISIGNLNQRRSKTDDIQLLIHSSNSRSMLSPLHLSEISESFKKCQNVTRKILQTEIEKHLEQAMPFAKFDVSFAKRFGTSTRISTDTDILQGYLLNVITVELHNFYRVLSEGGLDSSAWEECLISLAAGVDNDSLTDILIFSENVHEKLVALFKNLFSTTSDQLSSLREVSKQFTLLILKCLATDTTPFIAFPSDDGRYDPNEVLFGSEGEISRSGSVIQFPVFWSARQQNQVIFKSTLVSVELISPLNITELAQNFDDCSCALENLLRGQIQESFTSKHSFTRIDLPFQTRFNDPSVRISSDPRNVLGYFMNTIVSEMNFFYSVLASPGTNQHKWLSVFNNLIGGDNSEAKQYVLKLEDCILEKLIITLKNLFLMGDDQEMKNLPDVLKLAQKFSLLIIKCLASGSTPFISEPWNNGCYDLEEVCYPEDDSSLLKGDLIQFPVFWSARNPDQVFYKSTMIVVPENLKRNESSASKSTDE